MVTKTTKKFIVIAYDISDDKHREVIGDILQKYGTRINRSVFECMFTKKQFQQVKTRINTLPLSPGDQIVYYPICLECFAKIQYYPTRKQQENDITHYI